VPRIRLIANLQQSANIYLRFSDSAYEPIWSGPENATFTVVRFQ